MEFSMEFSAEDARKHYLHAIKSSLKRVFMKIQGKCGAQEFQLVLDQDDLTKLQIKYLREIMKYSVLEENGKVIIMWPTGLETGGAWMDR